MLSKKNCLKPCSQWGGGNSYPRTPKKKKKKIIERHFINSGLIPVWDISVIYTNFFAAIYFQIFVFMDIFIAINFCILQNWTLQEQCTVYLYGHFHEFLFLAKINELRREKTNILHMRKQRCRSASQ